MPVAQMTVAEAIVDVRSATAHDADTQTTDTQITAELDKEYKRVRRWISSFLPELYQVQSASTAITGSSGATFAKPDAFERLIRMEREESSGSWAPMNVRPGLLSGYGSSRSVAGNYRIIYVERPVDGYTAFDVPDGCEDLIILPVCAWVKQRHEEDPNYFMNRAQLLKQELRVPLMKRYGQHNRGGLVDHRLLSPYSFYEEGDNFVII